MIKIDEVQDVLGEMLPGTYEFTAVGGDGSRIGGIFEICEDSKLRRHQYKFPLGHKMWGVGELGIREIHIQGVPMDLVYITEKRDGGFRGFEIHKSKSRGKDETCEFTDVGFDLLNR